MLTLDVVRGDRKITTEYGDIYFHFSHGYLRVFNSEIDQEESNPFVYKKNRIKLDMILEYKEEGDHKYQWVCYDKKSWSRINNNNLRRVGTHLLKLTPTASAFIHNFVLEKINEYFDNNPDLLFSRNEHTFETEKMNLENSIKVHTFSLENCKKQLQELKKKYSKQPSSFFP